MENTRTRVSSVRIACAAGALALGGCVPSTYLYDDPPQAYYGGYGYGAPPTSYYVYPGYYGPAYAPPRVVYVDHDHRGDDCRHESHRDQRSHRDRDQRDREPCAGKKCGSSGAPPEVRAPREPRRPAHRVLDSSPESQREVD